MIFDQHPRHVAAERLLTLIDELGSRGHCMDKSDLRHAVIEAFVDPVCNELVFLSHVLAYIEAVSVAVETASWLLQLTTCSLEFQTHEVCPIDCFDAAGFIKNLRRKVYHVVTDALLSMELMDSIDTECHADMMMIMEDKL